MSYTIAYSAEAQQDLRNIFCYIVTESCAVETAQKQLRRITAEIRSLDEFPLRFQLFEKQPWKTLGLRYFPIDNYLIFYLPDTESSEVLILRIMHKRRNISIQIGHSVSNHLQ